MWALCFALVLTSISKGLTQEVGGLATNGVCPLNERLAVHDRCMKSFLTQYQRQHSFLASNSPTCKAEVFSCHSVDELIRCINAIPVSVVSNQCWPLVSQVMGQIFRVYKIPCTYDDIYGVCSATSAAIVPTAQRPKSAVDSGPVMSGNVNPPANPQTSPPVNQPMNPPMVLPMNPPMNQPMNPPMNQPMNQPTYPNNNQYTTQNQYMNQNMNQNQYMNQNMNPNQYMNQNMNQNQYTNQQMNQNMFPNQQMNPNMNQQMNPYINQQMNPYMNQQMNPYMNQNPYMYQQGNPYMYQTQMSNSNSFGNTLADLYMFNLMNGGMGPVGMLFNRMGFALQQGAQNLLGA